MDSYEIQRTAKQRSDRESRTKVITKQLNVRIDREFVERLKLYSIKTKKSQSWIVQEAIDSYLWNMKNKEK